MTIHLSTDFVEGVKILAFAGMTIHLSTDFAEGVKIPAFAGMTRVDGSSNK